MLLEALEILQNSGADVEALVTDLGIYKVVQILTVYLPLATATFLLSQEFIGEKIACFPPSNFSDLHSDPLQEYCWNEGRWISSELARERTGIYTQPHRYYPLYLPLQAILFLTPIIIWNILTKSKLLAALKGTEEFLDDLLEEVTKGTGAEVKKKSIILIKQFHETCISTAENLNMAAIGCARLGYELFLLFGAVFMQIKLYNRNPKTYHCKIPELSDEEISCTVPILDMLDGLWNINVGGLLLSTVITMYMSWRMYIMHVDEFQPLFYNNLPYGDEDEFNEEIKWETPWIKHSYRLLIKIFMENNQIMTRAVVLQALQPDERKRGWKLRLQAKRAKLRRNQRRLLSPSLSPRSMSPGSVSPHYELSTVWLKEKGEKKAKSGKDKDVTKTGEDKDGTEKSESAFADSKTSSEPPKAQSVTDSGLDSGTVSEKDTTGRVTDSEIKESSDGQLQDSLKTIKEEQQDQSGLIKEGGGFSDSGIERAPQSDAGGQTAEHVEESSSLTEMKNGPDSAANVEEIEEENIQRESDQYGSEEKIIKEEDCGESGDSFMSQKVSQIDIDSHKGTENAAADGSNISEAEVPADEYPMATEGDGSGPLDEPMSPTYVSSVRISLRLGAQETTETSDGSCRAGNDGERAGTEAGDGRSDGDDATQIATKVDDADTSQHDDDSSATSHAKDLSESTDGQAGYCGQGGHYDQGGHEMITSDSTEKSSDSDLLAEYEQIPEDDGGDDSNSEKIKGDSSL